LGFFQEANHEIFQEREDKTELTAQWLSASREELTGQKGNLVGGLAGKGFDDGLIMRPCSHVAPPPRVQITPCY
jgi:hypothetical protein